MASMESFCSSLSWSTWSFTPAVCWRLLATWQHWAGSIGEQLRFMVGLFIHTSNLLMKRCVSVAEWCSLIGPSSHGGNLAILQHSIAATRSLLSLQLRTLLGSSSQSWSASWYTPAMCWRLLDQRCSFDHRGPLDVLLIIKGLSFDRSTLMPLSAFNMT